MRTNLADNPIATWKDLRDGLGYRLPYGVVKKYTEELKTSWLLKGVTLRDLMYCELGCLPEYSSDFATLSDSQKRMYITKNTVLSIPTSLHTITLKPSYDIQIFEDNSTSVTLSTENGSSFTDSAEVLWYRFVATESMQDCTVSYNNLRLYVSATGPTDMSLHGQVLIRHVNTQNVIAIGTILSADVDNTVMAPVEIEMPKSFNIQKGRQYEIVLSIYATQRLSVGDSGTSGDTGSNLGGTVGGVVVNPNRPDITLKLLSLTFTTVTATLTFESNNKCVPYKDIKANTKASLPVKMYLKNGMNVISYINYCKAIYKYKLVGSNTWSEKVLGTLRIGHKSDGTGYTKSGASGSLICDCPVMPVDGEVAADYLQFSSGDAQTAQDFAITLEMGDSVQYLSSTKSTLNLVIGCTGQSGDNPAYAGCYIDNLTKLTGISLVYS